MREAWYLRFGIKGIRLLDSIINLMVLLLFITVIAFGGYTFWDYQQLYQEAEAEHYVQYKPVAGDDLSLAELQMLNPDVFGWLTVYGTNIDYPLVQGEDNVTYVNTSVTGESLLSGSIFLDYRNQRDFSDFNSIIYGHHMDRQAMFGDIGAFTEKEYFEARQYGNLYVSGHNYGIEFFAFLQVDAYDSQTFTPAIEGDADQLAYLESLLEKAMYTRPIEVEPEDHLVLLSTCSSDATNGRHILVGKLGTTVFEDPFKNDTEWDFGGKNLWDWLWILLLLILVLVVILIIRKRRERNKLCKRRES
ncbi:MAG: class B sortase [Lachnospiraceae bacterium]